MIKLNLACGKDVKLKSEGWVNVDCESFEGVDVVADLREKLPFENESVDFILCKGFLEHLENHLPFLKECHRILKVDGLLELEVPHKNSYLNNHLTHLRSFGFYSFNQGAMNEEFVVKEIGAWKVEKLELGFMFRKQNTLIDKLINFNDFTKFLFDYTPFVNRISVILKKKPQTVYLL